MSWIVIVMDENKVIDMDNNLFIILGTNDATWANALNALIGYCC